MGIESLGPLRYADGLDRYGRARSFYEMFRRFQEGNCVVRVADDGGLIYDAPVGRLDFVRIKHDLNILVLVFDTLSFPFFLDIPLGLVLWW